MTNKELHEEIVCIGNELAELEEKNRRLEAELAEVKKMVEAIISPLNNQPRIV